MAKILTGDGVLIDAVTLVGETDGIASGDSSALYPVWDNGAGIYSPVTVEELKDAVGGVADGTAVGDLARWDGTSWNKATKSAVLGYKIYRALITQTSTNAPTVTVLENELSGAIVWSYNNVGVYYGTLNDAFTVNKTSCICHVASPTTGDGRASRVDGSNIAVQTVDTTMVLADGILNGALIEVKVDN